MREQIKCKGENKGFRGGGGGGEMTSTNDKEGNKMLKRENKGL